MSKRPTPGGDNESPKGKSITVPAPLPSSLKALNAQEQRFVDEYLVDLDVPRAAVAAGYSENMAKSKCYTWVSAGKNNPKPHVFAAITRRQTELQVETGITQEMVLTRLWLVATADPNELVAYRRGCCRYCWGQDHEYQWADMNEWSEAVAKARQDKKTAPTMEGGLDYDRTVGAHPKCPRCKGEGVGQVVVRDTTDLSPGAKALYCSVEETKNGIKVHMHDQMAALTNVARHLGMFNDKLTLKGDEENPIVALVRQVSGKTIGPVD